MVYTLHSGLPNLSMSVVNLNRESSNETFAKIKSSSSQISIYSTVTKINHQIVNLYTTLRRKYRPSKISTKIRLIDHKGFKYKRSAVGHIKGFNRRFWQGNTTHRGTIEKPGRVATLVEEKEGVVYGRAFQVQDTAAFPYLENRECTLGGYMTTIATFYSREGNRSFPVIIYIATNKNKHWLGEAPLQNIAKQISECSGPNGHNVEYLLRLAEFMHRYLPEAQDEHLFTLELLVRSRIKETNMCLDTLMGKRDFNIDLEDVEIDAKDEDSDLVTNNATNNLRKNSFQFSLKVPDKTLRCLKM